jgi:hypothetical protein
LKTGLAPIATVMRSRRQAGLTGHAVQFNPPPADHKRHGICFSPRHRLSEPEAESI